LTARPSDFPDFALLDATDPTSGQLNAIQHPLAWQNYGFTRLEKPARQWFNWLYRTIANWLHYLDEQLTATKEELHGHVFAIMGETTITTGAPDWEFANTNLGWKCVNAGGYLFVPIPLLKSSGTTVTRCRVKYYNGDAGPGTTAPTIYLYHLDCNFLAGGAPTPTLIWTNATALGATSWGVCDSGALASPVDMTDGQYLVLAIEGAADDVFAG